MYDYNYGSSYGNVDYSGVGALLGGLAIFGTIIMISALVISLITIISLWKIFTKAGKPGWASLVPIYNFVVLLEIVELPVWFLALFIVPFANIYAMFKIYTELAHKFGKSTGFGVATIFFPIICLPMLAFGKNNVYIGSNTMSTQVSNNMNNNQYTSQPAFTNNQANINNNVNTPVEPTPFLFDQNVNTQINAVNNNPINNTNVVPQTETFNIPNPTPIVTPQEQPIPGPVIMPSVAVSPEQNNPQTEGFTYNPVNVENASPAPAVEPMVQPASVQPVEVAPTPTTVPSEVVPQGPINVIPGMGPTPSPVKPTTNLDNNQNNQPM